MRTKRILAGLAVGAILSGAGCVPQLVKSQVGASSGTVWVTNGAGGDAYTGWARAAISCNGPLSGHIVYGNWVNVNDGHPGWRIDGKDVWMSTAGPCGWNETIAGVWVAS
jgi:hypothetical protein